jgi:hypothetical protein
MRKITTLCLSILSIAAFAQNKNGADNANRLDASQIPMKSNHVIDEDNMAAYNAGRTVNKGKTNMPIWSEDFAMAFGSSPNGAWTTSGPNSGLVQRDLDGPDSLLQFGWGPLPSASAANGFAIFDFYNRFPDPNGFATSPAEAYLTSPTIDLTGTPGVLVKFTQQLYWCCGPGADAGIQLQVSTDNGATWPAANSWDVQDWAANDRHWNIGYGYEFEFNIAPALAGVANLSNVKIRFKWEGTTQSGAGQYANTYFWMIDDIEINELPKHKLTFASVGGAPEQDIIVGASGREKTGHLRLNEVTAQNLPISFDANLYNFGSETQTGVDLVVNIYDASNTLVASPKSSSSSTVLAGDSLDFTALTTNTWTPTNTGTYNLVYTLESDSIGPSSPEAVADTFEFNVTDSLTSLDFNQFNNSIGTNELGSDGAGVAARMTFAEDQELWAIQIDYSTATVAGGDISLAVHDTLGFDFTNGFATANELGAAPIFTVSAAADNGAIINYDVTDAQGNPIKLDAGTYFFVVNMFSNADQNRVAVANNASFPQPGFSSIMFDFDQGRWFTGYINSNTFVAPVIRANTWGWSIGIDENVESPKMRVFPNPSNGSFEIEMNKGGSFTADLVTMTGQVVATRSIETNGNEKVQLDFSNTAKGAYLLKVRGEDFSSTSRVVIR